MSCMWDSLCFILEDMERNSEVNLKSVLHKLVLGKLAVYKIHRSRGELMNRLDDILDKRLDDYWRLLDGDAFEEDIDRLGKFGDDPWTVDVFFLTR
eukprot:CAMPEP_0198724306 /NCGR_PEP_ID=MMETSP1475-20131203/1798_1 /TAXON_ID= ORGANISM="Unidentified sp., Strain CCMP1999" /NCGR_SAMPLE_ID=MMETSP1475 /ASSEMBLY_ACC=CAM_ASM_001111 /LENGTH=95 /DNA_ID=CAMNT_0044485791 /DNA_START=314 /DNA_END=601 /DNA_ORIENTATION=-